MLDIWGRHLLANNLFLRLKKGQYIHLTMFNRPIGETLITVCGAGSKIKNWF